MLTCCFVIFFAAAIVAVFALRLVYHPQIDRTTGQISEQSVGQQMAVEIPQLVVRRWIGLESLLTVGAVRERGSAALIEAVTDSPKRGADSMFRKATKLQPYLVDPEKFMFHTNAGPVAILFYSGSAWVAVAGASIANVVAQTTFFYLTLIFLLQLAVAVAFIALLERIRVSAA